jgi:hypothetical protein
MPGWRAMGGDLMAREWDVSGYTEVKTLGSGGFGDVVLARHDGSGAQVAIKYLHRQLLSDPGFAELFRAEAAVLASLDDPNVVRLYEYVESPAGAAIVMELVDGVSLRDILARQGKTTAEAALVVLQGSLLGLAAAHRRGVVHRDYKPENVLINGDGASKLTDFGIAARAGDSPIPAGTLVYAPPEQFGGSPATPASDVYAATATFYECLTGRPPFTGDTAERLLYQHLSQAVPLEPVPEPLRPLVAAGLAKDPGDRPADGTALVAELRAVAGGAYGPDWEDRGRSGLAAAALLLAALWPSGGPPAAQGAAVHRISLRRHIRPRHISLVKGAIAVGVAAVVAVAVAAAVILPRPTGHPTRPPAPGTAATSYSTAGQLVGVAAVSPSSAWAVGSAGASSQTVLMLHWNGTAWSRVTSPKVLNGTAGRLSAITVVSATDAWAVGSVGVVGSGKDHTLILHWNGKAWSQVTSPAPVTGGDLSAVTAAAKSGWAVGYVNTNPDTPACCAGAPLIFRLNGSTWSRVTAKLGDGAGLNGVAVTAASTPWAIGMPTAMITGILARGNGSTWTWVRSYPVQGNYQPLEGIAAGPGGTAFAVGTDNNLPGPPISMRWTGTAWQKVTVSVPVGSQLNAVAFAPGGSAWAAGATVAGGRADTLIVRWSGQSWTRVASPTPGPDAILSGLGFATSGYGWAVGDTTSTSGTTTVILHWNGQMWSGPAGQLSPAAAPASSAASSAVSSPAVPSRRQAAQALAALLAQSGTDRAAVTQAFNAVADCLPGLSQDETTFSTAASSRQALLGKLAALADRSALPAPMLQDLTTAWQASDEADQDFANWTQDEISHGCSTNYKSDASYKAATVPDDHATQDKKAFAALWKAIANEYGLPSYHYNQI